MKPYHVVFFLIMAFVSCDLLDKCGESSTVSVDPDLIPRATHIYPEYCPSYLTCRNSRSPLFIWDGHLHRDYDDSYEFTLFVHNEDETEEWTISTGPDTTIQFPDTLAANTIYRWRVRTDASKGRTRYSNWTSFTTGTGFNNPPTRPEYLYPLYATVRYPLDVVFSWHSSDPDGDEMTYNLWLRREQDNDSTLISDLTVPEYSTLLDADTRYYWYLRSYDEHGDSASPFVTAKFLTISTYAPHNPFPQDEASNVPGDVTLSWTCSDPDGDALTFDVYMGLAGSNLVSIGSGISEAELAVTNLDYSSDYEWMVTAEDDDGHRTSGPIWSFRTRVDPGEYNGVYAELLLHRNQTGTGDEWTRIDHVSARFDSVYAPDGPINPLRPDAVYLGTDMGLGLGWQDYNSQYYYDNLYAGHFLGAGASYFFTVMAGDGVPALVSDTIILPECRPAIISPEAFAWVEMDDGFELVWTAFDAFPDCDRPVTIRIQDMGPIEWTDINIVTDNDGSYTFTAGDIALLDPNGYQFMLVLIIDNKKFITAPGYDSRSWIWARTYSTQFVYRQQ